VRKAANRVRITGQLVDALTGAHLWADRFDGALGDIFELQDNVTASVVGAIAPKLQEAEIERANRKPTESLDAYDYFLRGMARMHQFSRDANAEALRLFYQAINLDHDFASAYGMAAWCYVQRRDSGWVTNRRQEIAETARLARWAAELGRNDAVALGTGGIALTFVVGELDEGATMIERALELNPNLATTWLFSGWQRISLGEPDVAIEHLARAIRLSPFDPFTFIAHDGLAHAHFFAGRYGDALSWGQKAVQGRPNWRAGMRIVAAAAALGGRLKEAQQAMVRVRENDPTWRLSHVRKIRSFRRPEDLAKLEEGLRKAGLPE
jgi:tetratricopeptide (TPR) repeat protein